MIDLGALKIGILTDADSANKELNSVGDTADKQESKFKKFGNGVKIGMAVGVTAVASLATGLATMATKASESAREIDKLSQQTGMTTDAYQEWDYIMKDAGYSMEQASGDMSALAEKALDASKGAGEGAELFGLLGVTVTDTSGKMKTQEEIFNETIIALQGMENETERNAIASALLSTTGEELTGVLNMTAEEVEAMKNKAHDLGIVMSGEAVDAGVEFSKNIDEVKASFGAVTQQLGVAFMPILQKLLDWVIKHMPEIQKVIKTVFDVVKVVVDIVADAFDLLLPILENLWNWISPTFPLIQRVVENTFGAIGDAVKIVTGIFEGVVSAIKTAIDWLGKWKQKDAETSSKVSSTYGQSYRSQVNGTHANGLSYVPFDGYVAELHKGERVLTAEENASGGVSMGEVVKAIKNLENTLIKKNMSIGKDTIGRTALEYAKERSRITGELAY